MPPGTFTDYTPVPPSGTLNILLLDSLNTPMTDQAYVRYQLQQYVKKAPAGTRIAIFGLSSRLFMLQGFTQDPQVLKDVVNKKLIPRSSNLLDDPVGTGSTPEALSDVVADASSASPGGAPDLLVSSLQQFEAEQTAFQTQLRIQYTLDAFNTLARYLSAFNGRKNLIWFSGAFPIDIMPDPTLDNGFAVMEQNDPEFRETTNLLARAQVAVYPVDARGLQTDPTFSAANSGRGAFKNPGASTQKFLQSQADEHMTMEQLAEDTGGHAFYNNNDLASAVRNAIENGSNYYTLTYTPDNKKWDGEYRDIRVALNNDLASRGYKLAYRHGYYADDPNAAPKKGTEASAATTTAAVASTTSGATYARATMAHGAPAPEDILFKVRVLPATTGTQDSVAPGNQTDPQHPLKGPFRRYDVDYAAIAHDFQLKLEPNGRRTGAIDFSVLLYDNEGRLLNATGKTVELNLNPDTYKLFQRGVAAHLEISAPVKGESFLRIGIHDVPTNRFGVVEIPISAVSRLAPPPPPPSAAPASPAAPAANPAGPPSK
jgi:VWFA-related protein